MDVTTPFQIGPFQTSFIEMIAVLAGLTSVWLMKKEQILAFPFGIINVVIYVIIFFRSHLYANAGINAFFALMSIYGWYNWTRPRPNAGRLSITVCSKMEMVLNILAGVGFFLLIRWLLIRYTETRLPSWDAFTTAVYILAQWMLSRKKIENWILWILSDTVMIGICFVENLYFSSFQYLVFTIIATLGFLEWRIKLMK
ncbi:MAG TPA: nicotinamide riboside transporter PnuC [Bacteroidales bacterium]|nr:nicotinamide riboside transporter PnuC [Bacteroidales bacterium]HPT08924.1 nicotinamide riboside transporter PnuC [Bacteroidales bacterium]